MSPLSLSGKTALVTGGGGKFGQTLCLALAQRGAKIIVGDQDLTKARQSAAQVGGLALGLDVTDAAMWKNALAAIQDLFGPLDLLFHCASPALAEGVDTALMLATFVGGVELGNSLCASGQVTSVQFASVQFVSFAAWSPDPKAPIWSACQFAKRGLHLAQSRRPNGPRFVLVGYDIPPKPGQMVRDDEIAAATLWGLGRGQTNIFVPGGFGVGAFRRKNS
jgi:NAD(P)-dependent dehydrogenase (short-subunit alcohol dehydrogenase family)